MLARQAPGARAASLFIKLRLSLVRQIPNGNGIAFPPTGTLALCPSCQATPVRAPLSRRLQVNPWLSGLASPLLRTNSGDGAFLI